MGPDRALGPEQLGPGVGAVAVGHVLEQASDLRSEAGFLGIRVEVAVLHITKKAADCPPDLGPGIPGEPAKDHLGRDHPRFHRGVVAFDLGHIEEAGGAADQRAAGEVEPRDRLKAALVERPRAIGDAPAVLEERADRRMRLEALKFLERVEKRVLVVEPDHKPDRHLAVLEMVEERSAIGAGVERPADGVHHEPRLMPGGRYLPQFLDADCIGLRVDAVAQAESLDQRLGQRAAAAFGEQGFLGEELDAALKALGRPTILADAHIACRDPLHPSGSVIQHLGRGKARIDLDAQRLGLLRQPTAEIA